MQSGGDRGGAGGAVELGEPYRPYRTVLAWYCWRIVGVGMAQASP